MRRPPLESPARRSHEVPNSPRSIEVYAKVEILPSNGWTYSKLYMAMGVLRSKYIAQYKHCTLWCHNMRTILWVESWRGNPELLSEGANEVFDFGRRLLRGQAIKAAGHDQGVGVNVNAQPVRGVGGEQSQPINQVGGGVEVAGDAGRGLPLEFESPGSELGREKLGDAFNGERQLVGGEGGTEPEAAVELQAAAAGEGAGAGAKGHGREGLTSRSQIRKQAHLQRAV